MPWEHTTISRICDSFAICAVMPVLEIKVILCYSGHAGCVTHCAFSSLLGMALVVSYQQSKSRKEKLTVPCLIPTTCLSSLSVHALGTYNNHQNLCDSFAICVVMPVLEIKVILCYLGHVGCVTHCALSSLLGMALDVSYQQSKSRKEKLTVPCLIPTTCLSSLSVHALGTYLQHFIVISAEALRFCCNVHCILVQEMKEIHFYLGHVGCIKPIRKHPTFVKFTNFVITDLRKNNIKRDWTSQLSKSFSIRGLGKC